MRRLGGVASFVVIFFVSYALTSSAPAEARGPLMRWAPLWLAGLFFALFFFFLWRLQRGNKDLISATELLSKGEFAQSAPLFRSARDKSPSLAGIQLGVASGLLQLFEVKEAAATLERARALRRPPALRSYYDGTGALVDALTGVEPHEAYDATKPEVVLSQAIRAMRRKEWQAAATLLDHPSQQLLWLTFKPLREVLAAWCAQELTGERRTVDASLLLKPGLGDLGAVWPELGARIRST